MSLFTLFRDDFEGNSLDTYKWKLPEPEGSFLGRTQLRLDEQPTVSNDSVSNGSVILRLDTHNPSASTPGDSFFGSEIRTAKFGQSSGLAFEARIAWTGPIQRGIVAGFFSYTIRDGNGDGRINKTDPHDEITFELLGNEIDNALQNPNQKQQVLTNVYNDDPLEEPGDKELVPIDGDLRNFNTFRVEWLSDRVRWLINGVEVRTEFDTVPDEDMDIRLNIWAAADNFPHAFDASFKPTSNPAENQTFSYEVDYVKIERLNVNTDDFIFWRNQQTGENAVWLMNGSNLLEGVGIDTHLPDSNWKIEATGDFNNDDKTDLVWRDETTGENAIWYMDGAHLQQGVLINTSLPDSNWDIEATGDFNNDGKTDLVWRNYATGQNAIWYMDGANLQQGVFIDAPLSDIDWKIEGTEDFNNDGKTDLVWRDYATGQNAIWYMDGANLQQGVFIDTPLSDVNWRIEGTGDFNNNGQFDLVWRNYITGQNAIWYMNGANLEQGVFIDTTVSDTNWQIVG
ncbi:MAG: family 16 glycosylhydrolase [Calothrix sp. MO_167.B12]|nr:family 16 glycosylhydrolase [Calothrix sp. MO_167.B12]